jgi:hypothetical protein
MAQTDKPKRREFPMLSEKTLKDGKVEWRFMMGNRVVSRHETREAADAAFRAAKPQYFR